MYTRLYNVRGDANTMKTAQEISLLDQAIRAILLRTAERLEQDSATGSDWYMLGVKHATARAISEIEILRDAL